MSILHIYQLSSLDYSFFYFFWKHTQSGGFVTDGRVMGDIAVSRAFGDIDFKCEEQVTLSCDPEIYTLPLDSERDEFVVVACDGLWDGELCFRTVFFCCFCFCCLDHQIFIYIHMSNLSNLTYIYTFFFSSWILLFSFFSLFFFFVFFFLFEKTQS